MKNLMVPVFAVLLSFFGMPSDKALADVSVSSGFEGLLVITTPEGEILLVDPEDPMPEILPGSLVEVFDGHFQISVAAGEEVEISCLEHDAVLKGAGSLTLRCLEETGLLEIHAGSVVLTTPEGETITLGAGDEYEIHLDLSLLLAPPTAFGQALGLEVEDVSPEVDPTSIDEEAIEGELEGPPGNNLLLNPQEPSASPGQ